MSPRNSAEAARNLSHGRGGAGNIGKERNSPQPTAADFVTPILKSDHYTTGRGGSGNMARNDLEHPEIARAAQDVEAPAHRDQEGPHHFGRGGAANVSKAEGTTGRLEGSGEKPRRESGLVEKGKEFLGKLGGKK